MVAQRYYHLQQDVHRPAKQVENEVLPSEYQLGRKLLSSSLINDQLLFSVTYFCYNQVNVYAITAVIASRFSLVKTQACEFIVSFFNIKFVLLFPRSLFLTNSK